MKKLVFILLSIIVFSSPIFASQLPTNLGEIMQAPIKEDVESSTKTFFMDFGGNLSSNNVFSYAESQIFTFDNTERLDLWLKLPFGKTKSSFFAFEGLYDFSFTDTTDQDSVFSNVLDLSLLKLTLKFSSENSNTTMNLGRFFFSDTTGYIFYQNIDGIFTDFAFKKLNLSFLAGYTGLINATSVTYFENPYEINTGLYTLSPSYFVTSSRLAFNIFNTQFVTTEFLASVDFGNLDYHKMYTTLTLNGAILQRFFYVMQSTLGMNLKSDGTEKLALSNLSRIDFSFYFNSLESSLTLSGFFASADNTGLQKFRPVTSLDSSIIGTEYSSITKFGLLYTLKPVSSIFVSLGSDCLCKTNSKNEFSFAGLQWEVDVKWQIVSDVFVALQGQQFIPFTDENMTYFVAGLKLGFSF